jgi:flagellar biosynthesis chaperone FliJ
MKNKFKILKDFRDQEVKTKQLQISTLYAKVNEIKANIINIINIINNTPLLKNGKLSEILHIQNTIRILRNDIKRKEKKKQEKENQIIIEQEELKHLNIEYEKIKHLFDIENKKIKEYIEYKEQEELDDISQKMYS